MKRFLAPLPILLLVLLNACGTATPAIPEQMGTAVAQTQTAVVWTLTASPTPETDEATIIDWLNAEFSGVDSLERTIDAQFKAVDMKFVPQQDLNNTIQIFRVDVQCECPRGASCCTPERIFVITMQAMKQRQEKILPQMPPNISEMRVVCFQSWNYIGVRSAWWSDARGYMLGELSGYQLGARVFSSSVP